MGTLGAMRDASGLDDMAEQIEVDEIEMHVYVLRNPRRLITRNADCAYYFSILLRLMRSTKALLTIRAMAGRVATRVAA
jgi:hypothetical protein